MSGNILLHCPYLPPRGEYVKFSYPGGEMQVRLSPAYIERCKKADSITIRATITAPEHIIELALLKSAIDGVTGGRVRIKLFMPYFPYARADRRFVPGDCLGLRAFTSLLFVMSFYEIVTLDAHSEATSRSLENITDLSPAPFVNLALFETAQAFGSQQVQVLLPDEGAFKRYRMPRMAGNNGRAVEVVSVVHATKKRDSGTGELLGFDVPEVLPGAPLLIVDDICDGGGTFIGIGTELQKRGFRNMCLYTTHGIFSKGLDALTKLFPLIFTTDSLGQQAHPRKIVYPCAAPLHCAHMDEDTGGH